MVSPRSIKAASAILRLYDQIGVDFFCPGPNDLTGGLKLFNEFTPENMTIVSSNLYSIKSDKPIFKTFEQVQLGSMAIGILGLTGTDSINSPEYYWKDTETVVSEIINQHKKTTDFFILLSSMTLAENKAIAKTFQNISIIVSADKRLTSISPQRQHKSLLVQTVSRGKYLGAIVVHPGDSSLWGFNYQNQIKDTSRLLHTLQYQLKVKQKSSNKQTDNDISFLQTRIRKVQSELTSLQKKKEENEKAFSHYEAQNYKLDKTIENDEVIEATIKSLTN